MGYDESDVPSEIGGGGPAGGCQCLGLARMCGAGPFRYGQWARLIAHFGADLAVFQRAGVRNSGLSGVDGNPLGYRDRQRRGFAQAQKVGALIALEADFLSALPHEIRAMHDGDAAGIDLDALEARRESWTDADKIRARDLNRLVEAGKEARAALDKRKVARRKSASPRRTRRGLDAMLTCAAPC